MKWLRNILAFAFACATSVALAQTKMITLGTQGGPIPSVDRAQPANALVVHGRVYLIDAGNGVARQLVAAGIDYRSARRIFITHNHDDHNADWGTLMGLQWATGGQEETHLYGPAGTEGMLKGFLQFFAPNARIRMADLKGLPPPEQIFIAHDIAGNGLVYRDDLVTVTAQENCHFSPSIGRGGQDKSYALRFHTPDKVIVFSGDTGRCPALAEFARGADLLVHEVIDLRLTEAALQQRLPAAVAQGLMRHMTDEHTTAEDVGRLAAAAGVKQVVLTHVIPGGEEPDNVYLDPLKKHFSGPAAMARDLMAF